MLFGVLRVTPEVKLAQSQVVPGTQLEGTLYVTCTAKEPVVVQEIWVKFAGAAALHGNVTHYKRVYDPAGQGFGEFGPDGAAGGVYGGSADGRSFETVPEVDHVSLVLAKTDVCVRAEASEFKPGVHAVPFSVTVPHECEGVPLPASAEAPGLGLSVAYSVTGVLKLASLVHRKHRQAVQVVHARAPRAGPAAETAASPPVNVGTWEKHSTRPWPALRYYLGANTAARQTPVVLNAVLQDVDIGSGPAYLQDALRLSVAPAPGTEPGTEPAAAALLVDCVRVELHSEAVDALRRAVASTQRVPILSAHKIDFPVDFGAAAGGAAREADITAVVSGARIAASAAPTLTLPNIVVQHWLYVRVGLRSQSPDGTRQAVAHAKLQIPIRIQATQAPASPEQ